MVKPRFVMRLSSLNSKAKRILEAHKVSQYKDDGSCILVVKADTKLYNCIAQLKHQGIAYCEILDTFNYAGELSNAD